MSAALRKVLSRPTNPAILPIPPRTTGNNVPKSLHKTRRTWAPNTTRADWAVSIPAAFKPDAVQLAYGGESSSAPAKRGEHVLKGVKMQMRRRKDVEKAGGIEGLLLSRPAKHLTPFGKQLRSALFAELHRVRAAAEADRAEMSQGLDNSPSHPLTADLSIPAPSHISEPPIPSATATDGGGEEAILTGSGI
ncbi:uncharacterized protein MKK02DRAFT_43280 [Dioszegia hungarica]|uniref:Uncharacterized protein n=1 Tax=Dioszegia hungarica TaxID=4972 RepID=A0AA38HCQ6_9TREE|nr:uncharacterized protein MKK02DRAFT_43280 [Dioszegia hungarica]KAI9637354.1 hypothetical protein MKK02DRAFT_43280 [Dioszegia hungarica]